MTDFVIEVRRDYQTREGEIVRCVSINGTEKDIALFDDGYYRWRDSGLVQRKTERPRDIVAYAPQDVIEGRKDDGGKARHDLIPPELLEGVAAVLTFGAEKYGERNWEKGMKWGRPFAALMRHMWAWWRGEKVDPETGFSHLWHAACCIAFLIAFEQRATGVDDRPA